VSPGKPELLDGPPVMFKLLVFPGIIGLLLNFLITVFTLFGTCLVEFNNVPAMSKQTLILAENNRIHTRNS